MIPAVVATVVYAAALLAIGWLANRASRRRASGAASEEYFLAGRGLGSLVLFMALFGTNCTAFVLVGIPSRAYRDGLGVFSVNAPIVALGIPLTFWAIGSPARRLAQRLGALTPAELYAKHLRSRAVGRALVLLFTLYTLPYMVTAVEGAALALAAATEGAIPARVGGAGVLVVAVVYTSLGGMRATAWTNVLQGALFLVFMVVAGALFVRGVGSIDGRGGGLGDAMRAVREHDASLLVLPDEGLYAPAAFASWGLAISLTVIAFPHMLARLMAADGDASLKRICRLYPFALVALWVPAVLTGVLAAVALPDLPDPDLAFPKMVEAYLPPWLGVFGFIAILAAVMSTLDAQLLTIGSMLVRDVGPESAAPRDPGRDVVLGRIAATGLAVGTYVVWTATELPIFALASVAFSGYVTLVPVLLIGVRTERLTPALALGSLAAGTAVYGAALAHAGGDTGWITGTLKPSWLGLLPVAWGFAAALAVAALAFVSTDSRGDRVRAQR